MDMKALLVGLLAAVVLAHRAEAVRVPDPDPEQGDGRVSAFYTWGDEIPPTPGQMLRTEPLEARLGLSNAGQQIRFLYSSTDGMGGKTPVVVSGEFFVPKGDPPADGWPVMAWAHGTMGMADICAPSWQPHFVPENNYLDAWLAHGFAIVATDYQGLGTPGPHPYQIVRAEAYSVLDSIRAVLRGQSHLANRTIVVGFSQGAGAAFATGGFAPDYAPDLDIRGIITTGIPNWTPDVLKAPPPEVIARISERPDPTVAYNLYIGLVAQQRNPKLSADSLVSARGMPLLDLARVSCIGAMFYNVTMAGLNRATALVPSYRDALARLLPGMEYPTLKLPAPVFVGIGENDRDVPPSWQLGLSKNACASGTIVEAHLYRGMNHVETMIASLKDSFPFAQKVLNGEPITSACEPAPE
jgi:pimeloyl-ACP methyl ester carboxylesterase